MPNNLRCLTIHQPWASCIAVGPKRIENRTFEPPASLIGNLLAIHAGKRVDGDGLIACRELGFEIAPDDMPISAIIAVATVAGWVSQSGGSFPRWGMLNDHYRQDPWYNQRPDNIGWVLRDVVALPEPVPCKGMQGVWWADQVTVAKAFEQIEAAKAVTHG